MCKIMKISRSSYYDWKGRIPCARREYELKLSQNISQIFRQGRGLYGSRRIKQKLRAIGCLASRRRISRLMQESNLVCKIKRKFKATTDSNHDKVIAPNLLQRQFIVHQPNKYWCGDITYVKTSEGWLYLATVIDLYSRRIVGWAMSDRMKAELVNKSLLMALWQRKPSKGLIWHTDQGKQYAADSHLRIITQHSIRQSMSKRGDCWDNAVAESFFGSLKTELIYQCKFKTREEAKNAIFEYIEVFYNRVRIHSANNYLSPVDFEKNTHLPIHMAV